MNRVPSPVWVGVGAVFSWLLVVFALVFIVSEIVRYRRRKTPGYAGFISLRSTTRRITGCVILIALGFLFNAGLSVIDFTESPVLFTVYWILCSFLALLLFLLGLLDLREVRNHRTAHHLKLLWQMTRHIPRK